MKKWLIGAVLLVGAAVAQAQLPTSTNTPTNTPTFTPSNTPTPTATATATATKTPTATNTPTRSNTPTLTPTNTPTSTATATATATPTVTNTYTPTSTPTPRNQMSPINASTSSKVVYSCAGTLRQAPTIVTVSCTTSDCGVFKIYTATKVNETEPLRWSEATPSTANGSDVDGIINPYTAGTPLVGAVQYTIPYPIRCIRISWTRTTGAGTAIVQDWAANWTTE